MGIEAFENFIGQLDVDGLDTYASIPAHEAYRQLLHLDLTPEMGIVAVDNVATTINSVCLQIRRLCWNIRNNVPVPDDSVTWEHQLDFAYYKLKEAVRLLILILQGQNISSVELARVIVNAVLSYLDRIFEGVGDSASPLYYTLNLTQVSEIYSYRTELSSYLSSESLT
jgi:hypothetical protein